MSRLEIEFLENLTVHDILYYKALNHSDRDLWSRLTSEIGGIEARLIFLRWVDSGAHIIGGAYDLRSVAKLIEA